MEHLCEICNNKINGKESVCTRCSSFLGNVKTKKLLLSLQRYSEKSKLKDLPYSHDGELKLFIKQMLKYQKKQCPICNIKYSSNKHSKFYWTIDHDHSKNKIKNIICHRCNIALGQLDAIESYSNLNRKEIIKNILAYKKWA
jgi:Recombination endonuclease VII.